LPDSPGQAWLVSAAMRQLDIIATDEFMFDIIVLECLGVFFIAAAFRMSAYGWGPARTGQPLHPPNLPIRIFFFLCGVLAIWAGFRIR
jgi:hypothetical protein